MIPSAPASRQSTAASPRSTPLTTTGSPESSGSASSIVSSPIDGSCVPRPARRLPSAEMAVDVDQEVVVRHRDADAIRPGACGRRTGCRRSSTSARRRHRRRPRPPAAVEIPVAHHVDLEPPRRRWSRRRSRRSAVDARVESTNRLPAAPARRDARRFAVRVGEPVEGRRGDADRGANRSPNSVMEVSTVATSRSGMRSDPESLPRGFCGAP